MSVAATDPRGDALLVLAADGDPQALAQMRARAAAGEPAAYVAGFTVFAGRRFEIDARAYITDPETRHLTDTVIAVGQQMQADSGLPPRVLEFGVGAGTLAITVKLAQPDWQLSGLDVDSAALVLAAQNARAHAVELELIESDYLSGWPEHTPAPDIIFGDPPWGSGSDLYDAERDERYYQQMPTASAFPPSGERSAIHDELIRRVVARGWPSLLVLNYGTLPATVITRSAAPLGVYRVLHPVAGLSVLVGRAF